MPPDDTRLLQYAVRLLARRGYPEKALRERLLRRSADAAAVEKVIDKLKALNYLNDFHWAGLCARAWAVERHWGPHRILHELVGRGVDAATAERVLAATLAEHPEAEVLEQAVAKWQRLAGMPRRVAGAETTGDLSGPPRVRLRPDPGAAGRNRTARRGRHR